MKIDPSQVINFTPADPKLTAFFKDGTSTPVIGFMTLAINGNDSRAIHPGGFPTAWLPGSSEASYEITTAAVCDSDGIVRPVTSLEAFKFVEHTTF